MTTLSVLSTTDLCLFFVPKWPTLKIHTKHFVAISMTLMSVNTVDKFITTPIVTSREEKTVYRSQGQYRPTTYIHRKALGISGAQKSLRSQPSDTRWRGFLMQLNSIYRYIVQKRMGEKDMSHDVYFMKYICLLFNWQYCFAAWVLLCTDDRYLSQHPIYWILISYIADTAWCRNEK